MKQVLILGSPSTDDGETDALERMGQFVGDALAGEQEAAVSFCHLDELDYLVSNDSARIVDSHNNREITDYDLLFFRGKFGPAVNDVALVSSFARKHHIPNSNSAYGQRRAIGKIPQMYQLHDLQLPIPKTLSAANQRLPRLIQDNLGYPVVVKDVHGAHGNLNFLVADEAQLAHILHEHSGVRFVAQQVIPNDGDFRLLLIGPEVLIIHRQGLPGSHLNNTSQGGTAKLVEVSAFPGEIIAQGRRFAELCQYELAGVDVIFDKLTGQHYFLEINSQPQIASGAFVAEKAAAVGKYFRDLLELP